MSLRASLEFTILTLFAAAAVILAGGACMPLQTAADKACEELVAYNDTPLEEAVCATVDDMIAIGNLVLGARAAKRASAPDGGAAKSDHAPGTYCAWIPHTNICATDDELAAAIKARKVSK